MTLEKSIKLNYQGVPDTKRHLWLRNFLNFKYLMAERAFREESLHIYSCTLPAVVFPGHPVLAAVRDRNCGAFSLTHLPGFLF